MGSFRIDELTAKLLEEQAMAQGMGVAEYLQSLLPPRNSAARVNWDEIEREMLALSTAGAGLPEDFSRADIYHDHN